MDSKEAPLQGRYLPPVIKKVVLEDLLGGVLVIKHFGVEGSNLLRGQAQLQGFAWEKRGALASVLGTAPHRSPRRSFGQSPTLNMVPKRDTG